MSLLQFAAKNIEGAPAFHCEKSTILTKTGLVRQSKALARIIKKLHSSRAIGAGVTVYVLRLDSACIDQFGATKYLSYNDLTKEIGLHTA